MNTIKNEDNIYWEASVSHDEADCTVYKTLEDACDALVDELQFDLNGHTEMEIMKNGYRINLYIKPVVMTEKEFNELMI